MKTKHDVTRINKLRNKCERMVNNSVRKLIKKVNEKFIGKIKSEVMDQIKNESTIVLQKLYSRTKHLKFIQ